MNSQATMTAAVWHGRKDIRLEQDALPGSPQPGWVQIRVHWCGICGSDLHEYLAGPVFIPVDAPHPLTGIKGQCILGHEFCGEIVEVAPPRIFFETPKSDRTKLFLSQILTH